LADEASMDYVLDGGETSMVEVAGVEAYALSVTMLDPRSQSLICLEINVGMGGTISAVLHTLRGIFTFPLTLMQASDFLKIFLDKRLSFSSNYISSLLEKSHSIPLTIKHLLRGKYGILAGSDQQKY